MLQPVIILVEPQMGENIGAAARVMSNFGLNELRIVAPRDGWPNDKAIAMAAHGAFIVEQAEVYESLDAAIADIHYLMATSAYSRQMEKRQYNASSGVEKLREASVAHNRVGVMFGCERSGLSNQQLTMADGILCIETSPVNSSLNLAQAVAIVLYELSKVGGIVRASDDFRHLANKEQLQCLLDSLQAALIDGGFLNSIERRESMMRNISNAFIRAQLTEQEVRTAHGMLKAVFMKSG